MQVCLWFINCSFTRSDSDSTNKTVYYPTGGVAVLFSSLRMGAGPIVNAVFPKLSESDRVWKSPRYIGKGKHFYLHLWVYIFFPFQLILRLSKALSGSYNLGKMPVTKHATTLVTIICHCLCCTIDNTYWSLSLSLSPDVNEHLGIGLWGDRKILFFALLCPTYSRLFKHYIKTNPTCL